MRPHNPSPVLVTHLALTCALVWALNACTPSSPEAAQAQPDRDLIPAEAWRWHDTIQRELRRSFGDHRYASLFGAKIHAESRWNCGAVSPVGAEGCAQWMPSSSAWAAESFASALGEADAFDPHWAVPAAIRYDAWHYRRLDGPPCHLEAKMQSAYNGGLGWVRRDERICASQPGCNPDLWFGHVENWSARSAAAFKENRRYVASIINEHQPLYLAAGYGGEHVCDDIT